MCREVMGMIETNNINESRNAFTKIFAKVASGDVVLCQNGKKFDDKRVLLISDYAAEEILSHFTFNPEITYNEEQKVYEGVIQEIGIATFIESRDQLIEDLIDMCEMFVESYFEDIALSFKFENHRKKYPYALRLKRCKDRDEIRKVVFGGDMQL
jgi:hypothetical protein